MSTQTVPMPDPDDARSPVERAAGSGGRAGKPVSPLGLDALAEELVAQARDEGISLTGPGGLLSGFTSRVLSTALEAELTEHLGHEHAACRARTGTSVTVRRPRRCAPRSATCRSGFGGTGPARSTRCWCLFIGQARAPVDGVRRAGDQPLRQGSKQATRRIT
jgi:hypothetical protein